MTEPGSMNIIMVTSMSGSRGDDIWPPLGGKLRVGTAEAEHLIRNGIAVADPDQTGPAEVKAEEPKGTWPPPAETAVVPEADVEVRHEQPGAVESDRAKEVPAATESPLTQVAPRRGPGRPRKDSLPS